MLSLDILHPLSKELPTVLQVDFPLNATGEVGFLNEGVIPKYLSRNQELTGRRMVGDVSNASGV